MMIAPFVVARAIRSMCPACNVEAYRYTFSDTDFAVKVEESAPHNFDPRHRP